MKLNKQEQKYRAKQQLANKFTQKLSLCCGLDHKEVNQDAIRELVNRVCK